jgi:predicted transcriptional regulator
MNPWGHNPSAKRRDKLFIIAEIIEIARDGSLKTQVMYRANLSFTQLNDYLRFMMRISLLEKVLENDKDYYRATDKGLDFLQRYREINELLKTEGETNSKNGIRIPPPHLLRKNQNLI